MKPALRAAVVVMVLAQVAIAVLSYRDSPRQAAIGLLFAVANCLIFGVF